MHLIIDETKCNIDDVHAAVAKVGHDTDKVKANDEVYEKLHGCCQYDRTAAANDDAKKDCCSKSGHDGKDCCKSDTEKMSARKTGSDGDCCKDGKCSMPGHDGKDCCKASH